METVQEIPVVIIGAGPAGATTSIFLAQAGIHHIIIDKGSFPRDKVCGDACSGRTTSVLQKANPEWLTEMRATPGVYHPTWGMTVVAPNGKRIDIPYVKSEHEKVNAKGFTVPRLVFDNFLYSKIDPAFATVYQNAKVVSLNREGARTIVTIVHNDQQIAFAAHVVVGADGDKSIVRKTLLSGGNNMKTDAVGLRAYYDGISGFYDHYHIELHYLPELPCGYLWIFPLPNGRANVGVGMLSSTVREKKINLREVMLHLLKENPRFAERFKGATLDGKIDGWGIPIYSGKEAICGDGFLLTGDAARLVDPFSGEGVGNALFSGMIAAEAIVKGIEKGDYSGSFFNEEYESKVYKHLGPELEQNLAMQRIFLKQWLLNLFFNKAFKSKTLRNAISHMFTDAEMHQQFKKASFYFKVLLNS